ncbi:MAG: hypothetical protein K0Q69_2878 [Devosia sp.]|jgi:hypothetical protein|nr:hypothetical protein [Devosia sp.]
MFSGTVPDKFTFGANADTKVSLGTWAGTWCSPPLRFHARWRSHVKGHWLSRECLLPLWEKVAEGRMRGSRNAV